VTIADFAADVRASTPSHAAEIAVPDVSELIDGLRMMRRHLTQAAISRMHQARAELSLCQRRLVGLRPDRQLMQLHARLQHAARRLDRCADDQLAAYPPRLAILNMKLNHLMEANLRRQQEKCAASRLKLEALNPARVLERGYALVLDGERIIPDAASTVPKMTLRFRDGTVAVRMEE